MAKSGGLKRRRLGDPVPQGFVGSNPIPRITVIFREPNAVRFSLVLTL